MVSYRDWMNKPPIKEERDGLGRLMARAQAGEIAAYRELLTSLVPILRSLARQALREPQDAEDALQDILLTLHQIRHTYDPARPFLPWLFAVARRRIIDRQRKVMRDRRRKAPLEASETFAAHETNILAMDVDVRALKVAVSKLPPAQRRAIELLKLKELSLKEAAAASGMSITSLKVATHRALQTLRKVFAAGAEEP